MKILQTFAIIVVITCVISIQVTYATDILDDTPDRSSEKAGMSTDQKPFIPLNPDDPTFNLWKKLRDDLGEGRKPGPINIQKFVGGFGWNGIPTFFRLPVALTPEDLKAGKVEVAILGAYTDQAGGMRGAAFGPMAVRTSNRYLPWGAFTGPHGHVLVDPFVELAIVDYGDAPIDPFSSERSVHAIREHVRDAAAVEIEPGKHVIPIIVGGDHSLLYSNAAGITDVYGKEKVAVVHFDAHQDAGRANFGHLAGHGQPIYRLIKEGHVRGDQFIQVGLRGYRPDKDDLEWMREQGFRYHHMAEIERRGVGPVMEDVVKEAKESEYIYISVDIDVLDPAFAPGTGTPEPAGLTPRELFPVVRRLCAESNVVGFELVELNPLVDPTYVSALNAHRIIRECLTGLAMHKKGITDPHYLHPLAVDDDRK